ncbi:uncharacterized protein LTR77_009116 [Saxophila tyrrhenica]|uniref:CTLH domain-containing protein n=1 Tax=Saxophila tyrrhenica TaxID=1690608 RepID=A0AAV9P3R5_9PEZI|nr:hypothetical protein LTR77_009116 [Saxophila tyrrhenica]
MHSPYSFEKKVEEMKPSKSDINWVIMDYLVSEGYPGAAEKFAQESNLCQPTDVEGIRERVRVRNAIHSGRIEEAIGMVNEIDPEILDLNPQLHFQLLQLQLIEIIRTVLDKQSAQKTVAARDFLPAITFATEQLSPRAPTDPRYLTALEETMALMVYTPEKMPAEFKKLLDVKLREKVASDINKAILESRGERTEAKIRSLVRARAWAETQAMEAKITVLPSPIRLDAANNHANGDDDSMSS